jgi:hypothetical protein
MATRAALVLLCAALPVLASAGVASCGARTGLQETVGVDGGSEASIMRDRFVLEEDAPPMIDVFDEFPIIDLCPDAAATLIYVIGESNNLYSFNPSTGDHDLIGKISCPDPGSSPFSMAVDRAGIAYVVFESNTDGLATGLFRVSTKSATCEPTAYDPTQNGRATFGMGFVANVGDGGDAGETLFVSQDMDGSVMSNGLLATIDTTTFTLTNIGPFHPRVEGAELTGTGGGRLFAFSPAIEGMGESLIAQIDPATAAVIAEDPLPGIFQGGGWAFGFWGGDFYTFTSTGRTGPTTVTRFDPQDMSITPVATIGDNIVGAGVSTCAPQN